MAILSSTCALAVCSGLARIMPIELGLWATVGLCAALVAANPSLRKPLIATPMVGAGVLLGALALVTP
jgi:hypothetical protein